MTCTHSIVAIIAALACSQAVAQLGNAPPSSLSAPGSSFGHQVQGVPPANAAGAAQSPTTVVGTPNPGVAPKTGAMAPAQMTQPKMPAQAAPPSPANQGVSPEKRAAANAATRLTDERLTIVSPRRALLIRQEEALRVQQDPIAQPVQRSPGTGIAPGVLASTAGVKNYAASSYTPQTAAGVTIHKLTEPGIVLVNGKQSAIHVTPGGKVIVLGYGFGDARGNAYLVGGGLEKQPLLLSIGKWRNDEIEAYIPGGTRGVADEPAAGLKVVTAAGNAYRMDGISFRAAREETTLTGNRLGAFFIVELGAGWTGIDVTVAAVSRNEYSATGMDCKRPGTDVLRFRTLNGFDVIGATLGHGRTDSGDRNGAGQPGGHVFFPGYGFGAWTDERVTRPLSEAWGRQFGTEEFVSALPVNWGVFRSHTSKQVAAGASDVGLVVPLPYVTSTGGSDTCSSDYQITSLRLYGPAGVAP